MEVLKAEEEGIALQSPLFFTKLRNIIKIVEIYKKMCYNTADCESKVEN